MNISLRELSTEWWTAKARASAYIMGRGGTDFEWSSYLSLNEDAGAMMEREGPGKGSKLPPGETQILQTPYYMFRIWEHGSTN